MKMRHIPLFVGCLLLLAAVLCGASCAGSKQETREFDLLVLAEDVPAGTVLTEAMLKKQTVEFNTGGMVVTVPWRSRSRVIGLKTVRDLTGGERLSWRDVEMRKEAPGAAKKPPRNRTRRR